MFKIVCSFKILWLKLFNISEELPLHNKILKNNFNYISSAQTVFKNNMLYHYILDGN